MSFGGRLVVALSLLVALPACAQVSRPVTPVATKTPPVEEKPPAPPAGKQGIAAGSFHSCALLGGRVTCWGNNERGQLGNGSMTDSLVPVQVVGLDTGVLAIALGANHSCALVEDGVRCWGANYYGQLGSDAVPTGMGASAVPVAVTGLSGGVQAITAGSNHTCALVNGGVKCWGMNEFGQLGDATMKGASVPVQVDGLSSGVQSIAADGRWSCAVQSGAARCWGENSSGQLANGSVVNSAVPVPISGLASGVQAIAPGYFHGCAIVNEAVLCWGDNKQGQLGNGSPDPSPVPVPPLGLGSGAQAIASGVFSSCALIDGGVKCWGGRSRTPVAVPGLSGVQDLAVGDVQACALSNGSVLCWGSNRRGELGDGTAVDRATPVRVLLTASGEPMAPAVAQSIARDEAKRLGAVAGVVSPRLADCDAHCTKMLGDAKQVSGEAPGEDFTQSCRAACQAELAQRRPARSATQQAAAQWRSTYLMTGVLELSARCVERLRDQSPEAVAFVAALAATKKSAESRAAERLEKRASELGAQLAATEEGRREARAREALARANAKDVHSADADAAREVVAAANAAAMATSLGQRAQTAGNEAMAARQKANGNDSMRAAGAAFEAHVKARQARIAAAAPAEQARMNLAMSECLKPPGVPSP
jgi:hypothetical protein